MRSRRCVRAGLALAGLLLVSGTAPDQDGSARKLVLVELFTSYG